MKLPPQPVKHRSRTRVGPSHGLSRRSKHSMTWVPLKRTVIKNARIRRSSVRLPVIGYYWIHESTKTGTFSRKLFRLHSLPVSLALLGAKTENHGRHALHDSRKTCPPRRRPRQASRTWHKADLITPQQPGGGRYLKRERCDIPARVVHARLRETELFMR